MGGTVERQLGRGCSRTAQQSWTVPLGTHQSRCNAALAPLALGDVSLHLCHGQLHHLEGVGETALKNLNAAGIEIVLDAVFAYCFQFGPS